MTIITHHLLSPPYYRSPPPPLSPAPLIITRRRLPAAAPTSFLLFAQRGQIRRVALPSSPTDKSVSPDIALPIAGVRGVRSIAYDPVERHVYWVDGRSKSVRRATDSGANVSRRSVFFSPFVPDFGTAT